MAFREADLTPPELASGIDHLDASATWSTWLASLGSNEDHAAGPPPLPEGIIPKVTLEDFNKYLASVGKNLDRYDATLGENALRNSGSSATEVPQLASRESSGLSQAMAQVPLLFFREDFNLNSPDLWKHLGAIDNQQKHQEVMEQLSLQLDTAETHLTHEIADRYESFFEASVYVQELRGHVQKLLDVVSEKRSKTRGIVAESEKGTELAKTLTRKRASLLSTLELCLAAQQVAHAKGALENSIAAAPHAGLDYAGALDILAGLQESGLHVPLGLTSIGLLPEYIDGMRQAVKEVMIADLIERSKFDSSSGIAEVWSAQEWTISHAPGSVSEGLPSPAGSVMNGSGSVDGADFLAMSPAVAGLWSMGALPEAVQALYKDIEIEMISFITFLVRSFLAERCNIQCNASEALYGSEMNEHLATIDGGQFAHLLEAVVAGVRAFLAHCEGLNQRITSILQHQASTTAGTTGKPFSSDCCQRAAYGAISCWAMLMASWTTSAGEGLFGLTDLKALLELTDGFASMAEVHAGKSISVLRGHIQEACRAILECMHASNMKRMAGKFKNMIVHAAKYSLDSETWAYVPISSDVVQCMSSIAAHARSEGVQSSSNGTLPPTEERLLIDGALFQTIKTVQVMLQLLKQYLEFCDTAPAFIADVSQRVVGLLRTFNSRTCQLILGAGAMQVSGLKSISAKHLAISCHSVRAIAALFPCLEPSFVQPIEPIVRRNLIADEYARTLQDMAVHCDEICNKIVTIMCDRFISSPRDLVGILSATPRTRTPDSPSVPPPSAFSASIVKQLRILADIMGSTSSKGDAQRVLATVLLRFSAALTSTYGGTELAVAGLDDQVAADLSYLTSSLETLPLEPEIIRKAAQPLQALHTRYLNALQQGMKDKEAVNAEAVVAREPEESEPEVDVAVDDTLQEEALHVEPEELEQDDKKDNGHLALAPVPPSPSVAVEHVESLSEPPPMPQDKDEEVAMSLQQYEDIPL